MTQDQDAGEQIPPSKSDSESAHHSTDSKTSSHKSDAGQSKPTVPHKPTEPAGRSPLALHVVTLYHDDEMPDTVDLAHAIERYVRMPSDEALNTTLILQRTQSVTLPATHLERAELLMQHFAKLNVRSTIAPAHD